MTAGRVTSKGQTTIPKEIRDRFELKPGDKARFTHEDGRVIVRPRTGRISDLKHILPRPDRAFSIEEMNETIAQAFAADATGEPRGLAEDAGMPHVDLGEATVTAKGQITVPHKVRDVLALRTGDEVFYMIERGLVAMHARNKPLSHLRTLLPPPTVSATLEEIEETIREGWSRE